ncbi:U6 snRNA phosphodiesterase Usb1 [Xylariaceae sp. FL0594]|nr:U6 snRNA phosphodiesterase Usb1 [Xylariaceae sp. FL0594]
MALVDYSSSDSSESVEDVRSSGSHSQPRKRQKLSYPPNNASHKSEARTSSVSSAVGSGNSKSELPPLPAAFHDLYASTVRVSASDDPTLHQGRKRVNPHKVGNWPSHLYIEWHPTEPERNVLCSLIIQLQSRLTSSTLSSSPVHHAPSPEDASSANPITITSFLTSDLGAPQPLHVSLSRPIVLETAQKDSFLSRLGSGIADSGVAPFDLVPLGLEWHRTEESARSFLVLRVGASSTTPLPSSSSGDAKSEKGDSPAPVNDGDIPGTGMTNPQLTALLQRCNALVTSFGQPALYAFASTSTSTPTSSRNLNLKPSTRIAAGVKSRASPRTTRDATDVVVVDKAFHISIAWSPSVPDSALRRVTEDVFNDAVILLEHEHEHGDDDAYNKKNNTTKKSTTTNTPFPQNSQKKMKKIRDAITLIRVPVDGVKAKIGNSVTHIPLPDARRRRSRLMSGGLGRVIGIAGPETKGVELGGQEEEEERANRGKGGIYGII